MARKERVSRMITGERDGDRRAVLATIGETMIMLSPPPYESLSTAQSLSIHIGGAESNVAMYLSELGHCVEWAGAVGEDPFGEIILSDLRRAGVGVAAARISSSARTGVYFKNSGRNGTSVHYYRDGSAAAALDPTVFAHPSLAGVRFLHLTGITAALSPSCRRLVEQGVAGRALPGALVSFDVNYRPRLWTREDAGPALRALADASDIVFVGLDEAHSLWGTDTPEKIRELLPSPSTLVVKNDDHGAHSFTRTGSVFVPAPMVQVVEPVGAGDAFASGYLSGVIDGLSEVERLRFGHLVASRALGVTSDYTSLPPLEWFEHHVRLPEVEWDSLDLRRSSEVLE